MYTIKEKKKAAADGTLIFNSVYDVTISDEFFFHKHFNNPSCIETPFIIGYENEKAVVMRWMMGMEMAHNGQTLHAVQSSDDAALEEARGLPFIKIVKSSEKEMKKENVDFLYGCYFPGHAMHLAEKLGEKHIVTLASAKMPISDTVFKWKRFNIPLAKFFVKSRSKKLSSKLNKIATGCNSEITCSAECPFTVDDYKTINADKALRVKRTISYYNWKLAHTDTQHIKYIVARNDGILRGFMIIISKENEDEIIDWDVYTDDFVEKQNLLASLLSKHMGKKSITVSSLNPLSDEFNLFLAIGFSDDSMQGTPVCICVKTFNTAINDVVTNPLNWKHRTIDTDYFLNN